MPQSALSGEYDIQVLLNKCLKRHADFLKTLTPFNAPNIALEIVLLNTNR